MVLMIDDDITTLDTYKLVASQTAYADHFRAMDSPVAALEWVKKQIHHPVDYPRYILLDLNMDEMSGFTFLDQLESYTATEDIRPKVTVVSGSVRKGDYERSLRYACVTRFVSKPFPNKELITLLEDDGIETDAKRIALAYTKKKK